MRNIPLKDIFEGIRTANSLGHTWVVENLVEEGLKTMKALDKKLDTISMIIAIQEADAISQQKHIILKKQRNEARDVVKTMIS